MRLVILDLDELEKDAEWDEYEDGYMAYSESAIKSAIVDTERHGHWEFHALSIKNVPTEACSECGEWSYGDNEAYCPCCGAKMDEVENNGEMDKT